jgi:transposase
MREGSEYFVSPSLPAQRRYEAMRAYFVEGTSAREVGERFGYSVPTVHQLATELRSGRTEFFLPSKPGPKGPRKTGTAVRTRILQLRAGDLSVTRIAEQLSREGTDVSAQTVWTVLHAEGAERLHRRRHPGPAPRLQPEKARALEGWPAGSNYPCEHAGLYLLVPAMCELGLDELVKASGHPGTKVLSAFSSVASLLLLKASQKARASNAFVLGADPGLGLLVGLAALPKSTHLTSYSYRVKRSSNLALLEGLAKRCRAVGLYSGEAGFNLDFHAVRHCGEEVPLEEHYVPARSQRTRSVLTFFAQDHASTEMVYANADVTKAEQAREVLAFADYWQRVAGGVPGLLCFDSKVTTYEVLGELAARSITFLTLRVRGAKELERLAALPASAWKTYNLKRSGRYQHPQIYEEVVHLRGVGVPLRQVAVRNIGHEGPTLLITNDLTSPAKDLFARYAERMVIENELDADISGFHLNALSSGLPLNVDLSTTLTVLAGNCYRLLARKLPRYELATPDRLWRHFIDCAGKVHVGQDHVRVDLALRTYTPVLIDAGFPEMEVSVPWWGGRKLRFGFPPR